MIRDNLQFQVTWQQIELLERQIDRIRSGEETIDAPPQVVEATIAAQQSLAEAMRLEALRWVGQTNKARKYCSYREAQQWAVRKGIQTRSQWIEFASARPIDIPSAPNRIYSEWAGWRAFLETEWIGYEAAQQWAIDNGITTKLQWQTVEKPRNLPQHPERIYKEWMGWKLFLGNVKPPSRKR